MKVVFRTDASAQIGSGHVMRCLTLADALRDRGAEVMFVCREHAGNLCDFIENKGYQLCRLLAPAERCSVLDWNQHANWLGVHWEQDARETISSFDRCDWLIVDHYALDRKWETLIRPTAEKIMVLDDLADRHHDCDLLLDQNYYPAMSSRYEKLVSDTCQQLIGPKYSLLREEFILQRNKLSPKEGAVSRALIFLGGNDPSNVTEKVLKAIHNSGLVDLTIDVVIGSGNSNKDSISALCAASLPKVNIHCQIDNMAELMVKADFVVCSGGTITWERCCLGIPAIVIATAENQVDLSSFNAKSGLCLYLGRSKNVSIEKIENALSLFCNAPELLQSFSDKSKDVVDGRGVNRLLGVLDPIKVYLRSATLNDCDSIYEWRNAEETRKYIFDSQPIPFEVHQQWFHRSLSDPNRLIYIAEVNRSAVGVLRYDISKEEAVVSIYLVPGEHPAGTGTAIIKKGSEWLRKNRPDIRAVQADILPQNISSINAFSTAGYSEFKQVLKDELSMPSVKDQ